MKLLRRISLVCIALLIFLKPASTQVINETVAVDTTMVNTELAHSPKKAAIYSAVLPGLGQVYNKKYWKVPIVYLGLGGLIYFVGWNNDNYVLYKQGYIDLTDTQTDPEDILTTSYLQIKGSERFDLSNSTERTQFKDALLKFQNYYRRNRDLLVIFSALFYGLNIIDASVDAHFFDLDLTDDLTFDWKPSVHTFNNENIYCIHCTITF